MVLPLKLNPFEESLLVDDRPSYPWNILYRLNFRGDMDRGAMERALATVFARHPLLSAGIERHRSGRFSWVPAPGDRPEIAWNQHDLGQWPSIDPIDLRRHHPVRIWAASCDGRSELVMHIHHVVLDGGGVIQLTEDFLLAYHAESTGEAVAFSSLEPKSLAQRGQYGLSFWKLLTLAPRLSIGLAGVIQFLGRKPVPLIPHSPRENDAPLPTGYPTTLRHTFSVDESEALTQQARRSKVTTNDMLARDLFLAMVDWKKSKGAASENEWLRIMVPMSMRRSADGKIPAANIMSTIFLDRKPEDTVDREKLLNSVHDEMELIKKNHLGLIYLLSLKIATLIPGWMERSWRRPQFIASAILTNLMKILKHVPLKKSASGELNSGGLTLELVDAYAPIRPWTCLTIAVMNYAKRLTLCINYDPHFLTRDDAEQLVNGYVSRILETIRTTKN